jgi:hypothetical protein
MPEFAQRLVESAPLNAAAQKQLGSFFQIFLGLSQAPPLRGHIQRRTVSDKPVSFPLDDAEELKIKPSRELWLPGRQFSFQTSVFY